VPVEVADTNQASAWFAAESPVLLTLVGYASAHGFDEHAWLIPWMLAPYLNVCGRHQDWVATQQVAVAAAGRLGDARAQGCSHYLLGFALWSIGHSDAAEPHVRQSLELFRELQNRAHEAMALNGLACMVAEHGRHSEALALALDGLRTVEANGHWQLQGTLENTVGWLYGHLGQFDQALAHCQRAHVMHRESGNRGGQGCALDNMAYIYRQRGDFVQSSAYYEQAIAVYRDYGAPVDEARALIRLGESLFAAGDAAPARAAWRQAEAMGRLSHPLADDVRVKLATLAI
jgi:tetratricopeptide (TPR) repeat protein